VIFEELTFLLELDSEDIWTKEIFSIISDYGFEQTLFAVLKSNTEPLENAFIRSNYAPEWRKTYDKENLGYVDPTVSHCLTSTIPLVWTEDVFSNKDQKNLYEEAVGYGLRSGVILPIHGPRGEFGMLSFVSEQLTTKKRKTELATLMPVLSLIRDFVFESSKKFLDYQQSGTPPTLTRRETEVLKWSMAGKSAWEVSRILNCSESTINFHHSNIKQKFGVNSKQQAIIKAIRMNIIHP